METSSATVETILEKTQAYSSSTLAPPHTLFKNDYDNTAVELWSPFLTVHLVLCGDNHFLHNLHIIHNRNTSILVR